MRDPASRERLVKCPRRPPHDAARLHTLHWQLMHPIGPPAEERSGGIDRSAREGALEPLPSVKVPRGRHGDLRHVAQLRQPRRATHELVERSVLLRRGDPEEAPVVDEPRGGQREGGAVRAADLDDRASEREGEDGRLSRVLEEVLCVVLIDHRWCRLASDACIGAIGHAPHVDESLRLPAGVSGRRAPSAAHARERRMRADRKVAKHT